MRWRSFVSVALAAIVIGSSIATDPGVRTTYASFGGGKAMLPTPRPGQPTEAPRPTDIPAAAAVPAVVESNDYVYIGPPTISRDVYTRVFCDANGADSEICAQAPAMYDAVAAGGADPAFELAHAGNESSYGQGGVGQPTWHNLHGIHGHGDGGCFHGVPFANSAPVPVYK